MNDLPRKVPTPDEAGSDARLDALLAAARWPEPSPESQRRLRDAWGRLSDRRRITRWYIGPVAAVAAAVLVGMFVWRAIVTETREPVVQTNPIREALPVTTTTSVERAPRMSVPWRPPTVWEAALVAREPTSRTALATRPVVAAAGPGVIGRLNGAVDAVAANPDEVAAVAAQFSKADVGRVERRLAQDVISERSALRRKAQVRLLAALCTSRSAPLLASLAGEPELRPHALAGLERVGDVPTLTALAAGARDDAERRRLLAALLRREPAQAVPVFLAFLQDDATEGAALAALDDVKDPPVDALFARLNDPRAATRLAAARAIGKVDGPAVTARLAWMLRHNVSRREALAALAASDGAEARQLFQWALESKELGAAARAARQSL
jgi:hypothetical protein